MILITFDWKLAQGKTMNLALTAFCVANRSAAVNMVELAVVPRLKGGAPPLGYTISPEGPHTRGTSLGGVPREQKMLTGHLPRVTYHQVC